MKGLHRFDEGLQRALIRNDNAFRWLDLNKK
jgi:hypothetical protein